MNHQHRTVLKVLFRCANENLKADLSVVADHLGLSCVKTDQLLEELDQQGLVDADRVRLTLAGLALAVSLPAEQVEEIPPSRGDRRGVLRLIA